MTDEQIAAYVGIPYGEGATGPDAFNCWGLLRHIEKEYFDTEMPAIAESSYYDIFRQHIGNGIWNVTKTPQAGDGVLLRGGTSPHVGIFVADGILHSLEGVGVMFTPIKQLRHYGFCRVVYYRLKNES